MNEKMKILQMIGIYYPTVDGVINVSHNYARELNKIAVCDLATAKPERGAEYKYVEGLALARAGENAYKTLYRSWADVAADVYGRYSEIIAEYKKLR